MCEAHAFSIFCLKTDNIWRFIFQYGDTVLHIAARAGELELVELLLEISNIDPNQKNKVWGTINFNQS